MSCHKKMTALGGDQSGDQTDENIVHAPKVAGDDSGRGHDSGGKIINLVQGGIDRTEVVDRDSIWQLT